MKEGEVLDKNETKSNNHLKKIKNKKIEHLFWGYLLIMPVFLGLMIFYIIPFFQNFYFSFTEIGLFGGAKWVGLSNYKKIFNDEEFLRSLKNTLKYVIIAVPVGISISTVLAVLLNTKIKFKGFFRTVYFLPVIAMASASGAVWKWIYNKDFGLLNFVLSFFGLEKISWLNNPTTSLYAVVIVMIWMKIGYNMIILLAGLQSIPKSLYEAAEIDGASGIRQFFCITLPLLTPSLFFVGIMTLISTFQIFDIIYMMVSKSSIAIDKSISVVYLFYRYAFEFNEKGFAAAIAVMLFIIIIIITVIQFKIKKKWVHS